MGDSRSAIHDDEADWDALRRKHGLKTSHGCYSTEAKAAQEAVLMGFQGQQVQKYMEAMAAAGDLRRQADDLLKPFFEAAKALKKIGAA